MMLRKQMREKGKASSENVDGPLVFESGDGPHPRFSSAMIDSYRREWDQYLNEGLNEYKAAPNRVWYPKGINLCKRLADDPDSYLLFMQDDRVPWHNNDAERAAREIKRKQAAAMEFRGFLGVIAYFESMSVVQVIKQRDMPILENIARIFSRESILSDSRRMDKVYKTVLEEVCEKDADAISKLKDKTIPEAKGNLEAARINLTKAQNRYEQSVQERISKAGDDIQGIRNMSKDELLDMDYFLNEDDPDDVFEVDGFFLF